MPRIKETSITTFIGGPMANGKVSTLNLSGFESWPGSLGQTRGGGGGVVERLLKEETRDKHRTDMV